MRWRSQPWNWIAASAAPPRNDGGGCGGGGGDGGELLEGRRVAKAGELVTGFAVYVLAQLRLAGTVSGTHASRSPVVSRSKIALWPDQTNRIV
jgi:hypothetical protein